MIRANIKRTDLGHYEVSGELVFDAVVALLDSSKPFFDGKSDLLFNLKQVDKTDSAGLALLVEWTRIAKHKKQEINFCDLPKQLLDIARVSGLDELLPIV
ncbi:MAG: anti-sigma-factor [Piscirickettsiaceae bacterium]|nr:MAG: anti-sigma-factor [Piscirickettsiaceae bacterium]